MKKLLLALICATLFHAAVAVELRDDLGRSIRLDKPAQRIITLAPNLTELVFAVGAGSRIVGTVSYSDYPAAAKLIEQVGDNQRLDLERIATLKPDLVLAWYHGNSQKELDRLQALGIPVFHLEPRRLEDIPLAFERLGILLGTQNTATIAASTFRARHAALRARYAQRTPVRVFFQVWGQPLITITGEHIISSIISLCGGENVFANLPGQSPQLSTESVVAADPDLILAPHVDQVPQGDTLGAWQRLTSMRAVRGRQLQTIPADAISRAGPRILDGADAVCSALDNARQGKKWQASGMK